jgi:hypothetical protein
VRSLICPRVIFPTSHLYHTTLYLRIFLSKHSSKMPPLDPVSQIFENQFIQAWEFFEAEKFDEVSPSPLPPPHQPPKLTPHQGQQPKRKALTRTPPRPPPQGRPAHHPRALAQRSSLARRRSSPPLREFVPGRNGADCRAGRGL